MSSVCSTNTQVLFTGWTWVKLINMRVKYDPTIWTYSTKCPECIFKFYHFHSNIFSLFFEVIKFKIFFLKSNVTYTIYKLKNTKISCETKRTTMNINFQCLTFLHRVFNATNTRKTPQNYPSNDFFYIFYTDVVVWPRITILSKNCVLFERLRLIILSVSSARTEVAYFLMWLF